MKNLISNIKSESEKLIGLTDDEINIKIDKVKKRALTEPLDNLIIEWFPLIQEVSFRTIGLKHFDTQLLAGALLNDGKIVEMKTGEGKTLVSTLPVALNALSKKEYMLLLLTNILQNEIKNGWGKFIKV